MHPRTPGSPFAAAASSQPATGGSELTNAFVAIKDRGLNLATYLKDKTVAASEGLKQRDWTRDQEALATNLKLWGTGAAERVQKLATVGWNTASTGLQRRITGGPLNTVCRAEATARPCPRLVLVCCTSLVMGSLAGEGLFQQDAPPALTNFILGAMEEGAGAVLPPPGTSPLVLASALKAFFLRLPEPLLTYKLIPQIIASGMETDYPFPGRSLSLLGELPGPNLTSFQLLLETLHRVVGNSAVNGATAASVAAALAPVLAWKLQPLRDAQGYTPLSQAPSAPRMDPGLNPSGEMLAPESPTGATVRLELDESEAGAVARVLEYAILSFKDMQAHGPYQSTQ